MYYLHSKLQYACQLALLTVGAIKSLPGIIHNKERRRIACCEGCRMLALICRTERWLSGMSVAPCMHRSLQALQCAECPFICQAPQLADCHSPLAS